MLCCLAAVLNMAGDPSKDLSSSANVGPMGSLHSLSFLMEACPCRLRVATSMANGMQHDRHDQVGTDKALLSRP